MTTHWLNPLGTDVPGLVLHHEHVTEPQLTTSLTDCLLARLHIDERPQLGTNSMDAPSCPEVVVLI